MKSIFVLFAFFPSISFSCPSLTGQYDCKKQIVEPVTTASSIIIQQGNSSYKVVKNLVGIHDNSQGEIVQGPYASTYSLNLGSKTENLIDQAGVPFAKVIQTVLCQGEELIFQQETEYFEMQFTTHFYESFSKNLNGDLVYFNNDIKQPIVCEAVN